MIVYYVKMLYTSYSLYCVKVILVLRSVHSCVENEMDLIQLYIV